MSASNPIDPERLAALLDGRLDAAEAERVRAELAASDDDVLGAYADAVYVTRGAEAAVVPIEARRRRRWIVPIAIAAAAAITFAVFIPRARGDYSPASFAQGISFGASQPATAVWGAVRGTEATTAPRAMAARIGALLTDLEVSGSADASRAAARELAALLDGVTGGAVLAPSFRRYADGGDWTPADRRTAGMQVLSLSDRPFAEAGAYLEAARLAAGGKPGTFFEDKPPSPLERIRGAVDAETQSAIDSFNEVARRNPDDGSKVAASSEALLRLLTR